VVEAAQAAALAEEQRRAEEKRQADEKHAAEEQQMRETTQRTTGAAIRIQCAQRQRAARLEAAKRRAAKTEQEAAAKAAADRAAAAKRNPQPAPAAVAKIQLPPKDDCMKMFQRMDGNRNGRLSLAEVDAGVLQLWPDLNNKAAVARAFKAADKDRDGYITKDEFPFFLQFLVYYNNLWQTFAACDGTGDGKLGKEELRKLCGQLSIPNPDKAFAEMDDNKSGKVRFSEFCEWMAVNRSEWGADAKGEEEGTGLFGRFKKFVGQ
jgi:Ca2+-binding EF-hand superfamily protein